MSDISPDPILAAIDEHRRAWAALKPVLIAQDEVCAQVPAERRRSFITAYEENIHEDDDPRWIAAERAVDEAHEVLSAADNAMVTIQPTTVAGVVALLRHAISNMRAKRDDLFDSRYKFERLADGEVFSYRDAMLDQIADALDRISKGDPPAVGRFQVYEETEDDEADDAAA